eukprot:XP_019922522.1 PREDICTED: C-C chemokine receptor type 2-like [Crassostrea gigas]
MANNTTNTTVVESSWYTCYYPEHTQGKSTCWELQECEPMNKLLQALSVFGFVSNVAVFILICAVRRLHKPMYTGIRMLTIPDALFLLSKFITYEWDGIPIEGRRFIAYVYLASFYSSVFHVILLSVQQYLMIAYPLKCLTLIRNTRILIASTIIWIFAFIINIPYFYIVFIQKNVNLTPIVNAIYTVSLFAGPIIVLGILHILKIKALKRSLVNNSDKTTKRVSQMISIVVGVYILTTTPINVVDVLEMSFCSMIDTWYIVLGHIGHILLLINHSINPYIYFISTPHFRRTVSNCFGYNNKTRKGHEGSRSQEQSETAQSTVVFQTSSPRPSTTSSYSFTATHL